MFQTRVVENIKTHNLYSMTFFFSKFVTFKNLKPGEALTRRVTKTKRIWTWLWRSGNDTYVVKRMSGRNDVQGGPNMTGTDLYVNKPHCAAAVRP